MRLLQIDQYPMGAGSGGKMKSKFTTKDITIVGLLSAITAVIGQTPLGFVPIGPIKATTMHIPTLIASIGFGPKVGGLVGLLFGGISMLRAITAPTPVSFVMLNPLVSILPRILLGVLPYYIYKGLKKVINDKSIMVSALLGSLFNTVAVLVSIYIYHGIEYAEKLGLNPNTVGKTLLGVAATNGIPESILAAVVVTLIIKNLKRGKIID